MTAPGGGPAGTTDVVVYPDRSALVSVTADRLATRLHELQAAGDGPVSVALTGGTVGIDVLARLRQRAGDVDWTRLDLWWGDERFVAADDPERNDLQAREALLDHVPVDPAHVHPFPVPSAAALADGAGALDDELRRAADAFDAQVAAAGPFDLVLLGMGPDGHVASLFPGLPGVEVTDRSVVAVPDSPKPPARRLSLSLPVILAADEVWLHVSGAGKAGAVAAARAAAPGATPPAGRVHGRRRTLWLLDRAAAGDRD